MARVMYIECFSGAAGDMLLGALIDAGVPAERLRHALGSLGVDHELRISRTIRAGISATRVEVIEAGREHAHTHEHSHDHAAPHTHSHEHSHGHDHGHDHAEAHAHGHHSLADIAAAIERSALSASGKARAVQLFGRLGEAEAAIHDVPLDRIHLHEVGAIDSIIDIVGVVFAMEWLGIDDVVASPLNVGGGTVEIAHGTFPVPAPATVRLLTGVPIYSAGPRVELVTPTGALLVSAYARAYGPTPAMTVERVGYGAGMRDFSKVPNVVRVSIGERADAPAALTGSESVLKIECEIDDMNPQLFGPAMDHLFEAGALDAFLTAVQMKKGRPGTLVTVLAPEDRRARILDVLFKETTTIGVRFERVWRETLERRSVEVDTPGGPVRIKLSGRDGHVMNAVPEFDDCLRVATATGRAVKTVQADALRAWFARETS